MTDNASGEEVATGPPPGELISEPEASMSWPRAILIGLAIVVYFSVATMWLPSKLIQLDSVASASEWVQNLTVTGSWFIALAAGIVGLRRAQRRGWI